MDKKENTGDAPYEERTSTEPHPQPAHYISQNNNNTNLDDLQAEEPNVERASDAGIGDSAVNDEKLTNFTSNHSADA